MFACLLLSYLFLLLYISFAWYEQYCFCIPPCRLSVLYPSTLTLTLYMSVVARDFYLCPSQRFYVGVILWLLQRIWSFRFVVRQSIGSIRCFWFFNR